MRIAVSLKSVLLVGLVVALPLLALPVAARLIDGRLKGAPPVGLASRPLLGGPRAAVVEPMFVERVSPASFEEQIAGGSLRPAGLDAAGLPPEAPPAAFDPPLSPHEEPAAAEEEIRIDDQTIARLQEIRQRLEEWGADYVIVETTDGTGQFRFHCRMIVDENSRFTRPFESTSSDPLAAGEQVLREVDAWRTAAALKSASQK